MIQLGKFVGGGGGVVADTNYLYPARWGWIKNAKDCLYLSFPAFVFISFIIHLFTKDSQCDRLVLTGHLE